jgi:hypothetical protein
MDLKHIATAKGKIIKAAAESKPATVTPTAPPVTAPKPAIRRAEPGTAASPQGRVVQNIHLQDMETVKELVERVGASSLKKLINVMAR